MQEVSGSIPLFSTKKALYFVGSMVLFFLLKQKMGAALFRLHRFQTFCRRASDTPDLKQNRYACSVFRADSSMPRPASVSLRWRSFYGRGWITQAALLKIAHWTVFAPSSATGPQLFESTRMKTQSFCKQKTASVSLRWRSFYGRGWITRAAHLKKPRRGFFPRRTVRRVDAVRIHPLSLREGYYKTETPVPGSDTGVLSGRGWIRTTEAEKQQIYSLSPLATREHAHILFAVIADCLYILSSEVAFVNYFFHGFSLFLSFSIFLRFTAIKALPITAKDPKTFSVLRSFWSW